MRTDVFLLFDRILDLIFMFLLVWYYCTLTIRESILRVNGSRIKGWYRAHHFISCVLSGILLVWPVSQVYHMFKMQFNIFNVYICEYMSAYVSKLLGNMNVSWRQIHQTRTCFISNI